MSTVSTQAWDIARRHVPYFETTWAPNRNAILAAVTAALKATPNQGTSPMTTNEAVPMDPRTGRPVGDHGTANDAIAFALDTSQGLEAEDFLRAWREGDLDEYPDFYEWLAAREAPEAVAA